MRKYKTKNVNLFIDKLPLNTVSLPLINLVFPNAKIIFNHFNDGIEDSNLAFLIGFPRSGTTLLDTILRSHKDIEVIEEKPLISTIEDLLGSPLLHLV